MSLLFAPFTNEKSVRLSDDTGVREAGSGGVAQPGQTMKPAAKRAPAASNGPLVFKRMMRHSGVEVTDQGLNTKTHVRRGAQCVYTHTFGYATGQEHRSWTRGDFPV